MNQVQVILPYSNASGMWAFDDEKTGLVNELLVFGTDIILDELVRDHLGFARRAPFRLIFSHVPFPGHHIALKWQRAGDGGNWYARQPDGKEGWLCPALFLYFPLAPPSLYARAEPPLEDNPLS